MNSKTIFNKNILHKKVKHSCKVNKYLKYRQVNSHGNWKEFKMKKNTLPFLLKKFIKKSHFNSIIMDI